METPGLKVRRNNRKQGQGTFPQSTSVKWTERCHCKDWLHGDRMGWVTWGGKLKSDLAWKRDGPGWFPEGPLPTALPVLPSSSRPQMKQCGVWIPDENVLSPWAQPQALLAPLPVWLCTHGVPGRIPPWNSALGTVGLQGFSSVLWPFEVLSPRRHEQTSVWEMWHYLTPPLETLPGTPDISGKSKYISINLTHSFPSFSCSVIHIIRLETSFLSSTARFLSPSPIALTHPRKVNLTLSFICCDIKLWAKEHFNQSVQDYAERDI